MLEAQLDRPAHGAPRGTGRRRSAAPGAGDGDAVEPADPRLLARNRDAARAARRVADRRSSSKAATTTSARSSSGSASSRESSTSAPCTSWRARARPPHDRDRRVHGDDLRAGQGSPVEADGKGKGKGAKGKLPRARQRRGQCRPPRPPSRRLAQDTVMRALVFSLLIVLAAPHAMAAQGDAAMAAARAASGSTGGKPAAKPAAPTPAPSTAKAPASRRGSGDGRPWQPSPRRQRSRRRASPTTPKAAATRSSVCCGAARASTRRATPVRVRRGSRGSPPAR